MLNMDMSRKAAIFNGLQRWYNESLKENPLVSELELDENGLIPIPETKK